MSARPKAASHWLKSGGGVDNVNNGCFDQPPYPQAQLRRVYKEHHPSTMYIFLWIFYRSRRNILQSAIFLIDLWIFTWIFALIFNNVFYLEASRYLQISTGFLCQISVPCCRSIGKRFFWGGTAGHLNHTRKTKQSAQAISNSEGGWEYQPPTTGNISSGSHFYVQPGTSLSREDLR